MNENFDRCLTFVLKWEGGYSYDKDDPGGETNFGIDKRSHPDLDIKNLTLEKAKEIYFREYWIPSSCDKMVWPYDIITFDAAVNLGQKRAFILNQEYPNWAECLLGRIGYYLRISEKTHNKFLKGWINRVMDLYQEVKKR